MATKKDVSIPRITYGYPGATYPTLKFAVDMAKIEYERAVEKAEKEGKKIKESYDQALVMEETSVYLKLTMVDK